MNVIEHQCPVCGYTFKSLNARTKCPRCGAIIYGKRMAQPRLFPEEQEEGLEK